MEANTYYSENPIAYTLYNRETINLEIRAQSTFELNNNNAVRYKTSTASICSSESRTF